LEHSLERLLRKLETITEEINAFWEELSTRNEDRIPLDATDLTKLGEVGGHENSPFQKLSIVLHSMKPWHCIFGSSGGAQWNQLLNRYLEQDLIKMHSL
jgi:hypothetical protein